MSVYGSDRLTKDVDVACRDEGLPELEQLKKLSFGGYAARTPSGHLVDVVVRDDEYRPLYLAAIGDARDEGLPLRVVSPEYLAALKMAAARDQDVLDLGELLRLGVLDLPETRSIIRQHLGVYAAREWDSLVAEVENIRRQHRLLRPDTSLLLSFAPTLGGTGLPRLKGG